MALGTPLLLAAVGVAVPGAGPVRLGRNRGCRCAFGERLDDIGHAADEEVSAALIVIGILVSVNEENQRGLHPLILKSVDHAKLHSPSVTVSQQPLYQCVATLLFVNLHISGPRSDHEDVEIWIWARIVVGGVFVGESRSLATAVRPIFSILTESVPVAVENDVLQFVSIQIGIVFESCALMLWVVFQRLQFEVIAVGVIQTPTMFDIQRVSIESGYITAVQNYSKVEFAGILFNRVLTCHASEIKR